MVSITRKDLLKLERVGVGNFGTIYKNGDKVYKIYHEKVRTEYDTFRPNPSLKLDKAKINKYLKLDKKLLYTDLIKDIIYIDGKFSGVVLPYYNGETLCKTLELPVEEKIETAHQLVRNSKELTDNKIYPLDYKLNNIMLVDGNPKFIDLDDAFTFFQTFSFPTKTKEVVKNLDKTIKTYFNDTNYYPFNKKIIKLLAHNPTPNTNYEELSKYIESKSKRHNYIFIDSNIDTTVNMRLLKNPNFRTIYVYSGSNNELTERNIQEILEKRIDLYDVVSSNMMRKYIRSINYDECISLSKDKNLYLKKKH